MKTARQIAKDLGFTRAYIWQIVRELQIKPEFLGSPDGVKRGTLAVFSDADVKKIKNRLVKPKGANQ